MSLFKERIPYKPFEYPIYYTEGWLKQAQAFWLHTEIPIPVTLRNNEDRNNTPEYQSQFTILRIEIMLQNTSHSSR